MDILGLSDRRRFRSAQEKAELLAEVDAEGGKMRLVARRQNISESLIYNWRSAREAAAVAMGAPENVEFIPTGIIEGPVSRAVPAMVSAASEREPESAPPFATDTDKTGAIEITLPNGKLGEDVTGGTRLCASTLPGHPPSAPKICLPGVRWHHPGAGPGNATPRGRATPAMLAHLLVSKYCDHLPLYRQCEIYAREGLELERSALCDWVGQAAWLLAPVNPAFNPHMTLSYDLSDVPEQKIKPINWTVNQFTLTENLLGKHKHIEQGRWLIRP